MRKRKDMAWNLFIFQVIVSASVQSYPIAQSNADKIELKDERGFPNGTVVGKYSYKDKEGNPIQVKYYADGSSYGVELNSVKVVHDSLEPNSLHSNKPSKIADETTLRSKAFEASKFLPTVKHKSNNKDPLEYLEKKTKNIYKANKTPDYDIYLQTELSTPNKCGKEKVRVYNFEKDKRAARNVINNDDMSKFCEQF